MGVRFFHLGINCVKENDICGLLWQRSCCLHSAAAAAGIQRCLLACICQLLVQAAGLLWLWRRYNGSLR